MLLLISYDGIQQDIAQAGRFPLFCQAGTATPSDIVIGIKERIPSHLYSGQETLLRWEFERRWQPVRGRSIRADFKESGRIPGA